MYDYNHFCYNTHYRSRLPSCACRKEKVDIFSYVEKLIEEEYIIGCVSKCKLALKIRHKRTLVS